MGYSVGYIGVYWVNLRVILRDIIGHIKQKQVYIRQNYGIYLSKIMGYICKNYGIYWAEGVGYILAYIL